MWNWNLVWNSKSTRYCSVHVAKICVFLAMGSIGPRFRWPSAHSKDRHGGDCCSYTRHWKCPQIVPVVEGELTLLLIYYRLSPMKGWRVIEPPGHHPLQGSFQTTNTKETLTATFLLHVSKSSDAVKTKSCGIEDTAQKRPKKDTAQKRPKNPNQQLATFHTLSG